MAMTPEKKAEMSARMKAKWAGRRASNRVETLKAATTVLAAEIAPAPKADEPKPIPVNLFSGFRKKFDIMGKNGSMTDPIPGYRLYAFLDDDGGATIQAALTSGWQFVSKDEVVLNDAWNTPLDTDLGSKIRVPAEQRDEGGRPLYHYIMKKPLELDKIHSEERERYHLKIEEMLRQGSFNMSPGEKRYTAANPPMGSPSGLPPISISSKINR